VILGLGGCGGAPTWGGKTARAWWQQLKSPEPAARREAAAALGHFEVPFERAIPDLVDCLGDADSALRVEAARTLGRMGPLAKPAAPHLVKLLRDDDPEVRKAATEALQDLNTSHFVQ
jgi:HEAT repeat protein